MSDLRFLLTTIGLLLAIIGWRTDRHLLSYAGGCLCAVSLGIQIAEWGQP